MLLNEYGDHPMTHNFLVHALCIKDNLQQRKACTSSFGKHGLSILHGGDGGWQKRALQWWLILGEYGLTSFVYPYYSFPSSLHNAEMMEFGSNKANKAKNGGIEMLIQIYKHGMEECSA